MTSKMAQKVTSVLAAVAIAILLAIIVLVWVQVGHGSFRPKQQPVLGDSVREGTEVPKSSRNLEPNKDIKKNTLDISHLDDLAKHVDTEFVKPMKISPPPLHDHDIIYDQLHNTQDHPPLRHHSGHFRHKTAEVWDPHPRYEIQAFGRKFELELTHNDKFVSPKLQITHVWQNYTRKAMHDPKTSGCFYTGTVIGEKQSNVAVSLCNGMTGYIRTFDGNYYIEPVEKLQNNSGTSLLHRIKRIEHETGIYGNEIDGIETDICETPEKHTDPSTNSAEEEHEHLISKRDLYFDYLDTSDSDDYPIPYRSRPTRHIPWEDNDNSFEFVPRNKRTGDQEYHIETMVVADKIMAQYHNTDEDLIHYILTLMSHVALLYKDKSIGNPISVAVVKIWILKDKEFRSPTSDKMLRSFCDWQKRYNKELHHDTALLLTRDSICKTSKVLHCNTLGVAEVSSMCNPDSSCAIVKDKGLSTSYTIAHELGHVLSMPHDNDEKCVSFNGGVNANNIMNKVLQNDTKPWMWSSCSRHFLTEFLESNRASCLLDAPNTDFITSKFAKMFPGEKFEVDRQCELEFGFGYKLCPYEEMPHCDSLWCTANEELGCKTQHMPWAEGTLCGEQSWCHHGKCVVQDRNLLKPINGGWGDWQQWGSCSRTCGGGVKMARRACDSPSPANGGAYCTGRSIEYASCNLQPCDPNSPDFREVQCSEFDGNPKGIHGLTSTVKWIPKYGIKDPDDVCKLFCRVRNTAVYYLLKEKVTDGTKCGLNSFDICVNGYCRSGGCDNQLDSKAELDECGICGGDNSKCEEISGTYNVSSYGYTRVIRFPKGSSNIYITQRGLHNTSSDDSFLALVDGESGNYVLNGNFVVSPHVKDVVFGGMTISYSGSERVIEHISSPKHRRLVKDLILEVLSVGKQLPPDITYRYTISRENAPRHAWRLYDQHWTKCSSLCSGKQYIMPTCIQLLNSVPVPNKHCTDLDMSNLIQQKDCNTHCRFIWNVASQGHCSSNCGQGMRPVMYNCVRVNENDEVNKNVNTVVNERHCLMIPKPSDFEPCQGPCDSMRWEYDEWTQCTKSCGRGMQRRQARCMDEENNTVSDSNCNENDKVVQQICNAQNCPVWSFDEWSPCSVTCGRGFRKKPYFCHLNGRTYNPDACDPKLLPVIEEECNERPCVSWTTGEWGECNVTCGSGIESRDVSCKTSDLITVEDEQCSAFLKPNSTRFCSQYKCEALASYKREEDIEDNYIIPPLRQSNFKWVTGAWSKCTKPCGGGTKSRMVVCRNISGNEDSQECNVNEKPIHSVECNSHVCPVWNFGAWSPCDAGCLQHRQVSCQNSTGSLVEDDQCDMSTKPFKTTKCNTKHCIQNGYTHLKEHHDQQYKWKVGRWGRCSKSCGKGTRSRTVRCNDIINSVNVVDQYCTYIKKPKAVRPCERTNCDYMWVEGNWSQCSQTCGQGSKIRNVTCHKVINGGFIDQNPLPDSGYCDIYNKPPTRSACIDSNCNDLYSWSLGPWSECSHACGKKGRQVRSLFCVDRDGRKVRQPLCPASLKPRKKRKCNQKKCLFKSCKELKERQSVNSNKDYHLLISDKSALVYCYKMDTEEPEEFISLKANVQNYAEMYDKSLRNRDTCPSNGRREENCDCMSLGTERSGFTIFWKVRLNITSLQIITNDFTFSKQIRGKQIAYGTAGDCYSEQEGCIQGRFSIDLGETSFRLSRSVQWSHNGPKARSEVDIQERSASGVCGGYCGSCFPDPTIGLAIEVT